MTSIRGVGPGAPGVSVGLPFYNAGNTLADAIRSVFAQTYQDWELLLVDDGSSDRSLEIARAVKDPRVRVLSDGRNKGLAARLNEISAAACGRYIARMDADDLMHPVRLARQVSLLDGQPHVNVVGTATYATDVKRQPHGVRGHGPLETRLARVLQQGLFVHPTVMARSSWMRANPYRAEYPRAEDLELWCRTCSSMSAALLPEPLHFYREAMPINTAAYLATCRTARRITRVFGPSGVGRWGTAALLLRLHLTGATYRWSGPLRLQSWLLKRRSTPLAASQRDHALAIVRRVLETRVPGLDPVPPVMAPDAGCRPGRVRLVHATTVPMTLRFLHGQVGFMKEQGVEVLMLSSPGSDLDAFSSAERVSAYAVEMPRRITPARDLCAVAQIWHWLRQARPEIVHAHTPKCGLLVTVAAWLARTPVRVYHIHGLPMLSATGLRRLMLRWSERVACRLATQVLCVSKSVRKVAIAERLCPAAKIKVLGGGTINGIDAAGRFNPANLAPDVRRTVRAQQGIPEAALVVGFVGRIVRDKGVVELVGAWRALRERFPSLHLLIVGPFESQDPLPPEVARVLGTDSRIHLVGLEWNTPPLYAAMDLLVLPTYREGFPTVPLEAGAMELPVVATRVPGCTDAVVDGETGLLAEPRDVVSLTERISAYVVDPERRRRHGRAGRERVLREFRQEVIWAATWQEYVRLLTDARRPPLTPMLRPEAGEPLPLQSSPECA